MKSNFFARCNDCISIMNNIIITTDLTEVETLQAVQTTHSQYITSFPQMYYAKILFLKDIPNTYLRIVHDNMDKSKNSIPRLGNKENDISNVLHILVSLTSLLTYGHKTGGFDYSSLSFLEIGSLSL